MKRLTCCSVMLLLWFSAVKAQMVNVTFRANTATVPDTLGPNTIVQIRGTTITAAGRAADDASADTLSPGTILTWNGKSTLFLINVGGDYWEGTFAIPAGTKLAYKFYTNAHDTVYGGATWEHQGWEADISPGTYGANRGLDLTGFAGSDTTLPLQFVNGLKNGLPQFFKPYVESDSIDVWFRVNMAAWEDFDDQTQVVGVRGGTTPGYLGDLSWAHTFFLNQEGQHGNYGSRQYNGKHFWSGRVRIPKEDVSPGQQIKYKFVIMNKGDPDDAEPVRWEQIDDRYFYISADKPDTTLHWVWFEDMPSLAAVHPDTVVITYLVDMSRAIQNRGFAFGDTLQARAGYFATAKDVRTVTLQRQGFTTLYSAVDTLVTKIGREIYYQYYTIKRGTEYREVYYNFYYKGDIIGAAERRPFVIPGKTVTIADTVWSKSDPRRMPFFRNTSVIAQDVLVTYTCDVRPAIYQVLAGDTLKDIQGNVHVTDADSILAWGLAINGPATGSWHNPIGPDWGPHLMTLENKRMYDDGTHGDAVAGDSIFTTQFYYYKDSLDVVGQEFKFGIGGGDNEGGYGNNHIENIDDSQPTCTIASQFGSIDPLFYWAWDYDRQQPTGVVKIPQTTAPLQYSLSQNYPNPFNPETSIRYTIPKPERVKLVIFNLLGQKITTLLDKKQPPGSYLVTWDGRDSFGRPVASGLYFFKMEAGHYVNIKKMLHLK